MRMFGAKTFFQVSGVMAALFLSACIGAGSNSAVKPGEQGYFPQMTGIDLTGKERVLPGDFQGHYNIIAVAFEREQQEAVNTWIDVMPQVLADNPDVRFYEVPLIYELNAAKRFWVNNGMRSGIPDEAARERTITVYTEREKFLDFMSMNTGQIYVLVLDKDGRILWQMEGVASQDAVDDLKTLFSNLRTG